MSHLLASEDAEDATGSSWSHDDQRELRHAWAPAPVHPIIGREDERAAIHALLTRGDARLITLTGPGGVGKTRLVQAAAADAAGTCGGAAAFAPLAPVQDASLVLAAIAHRLDVQEGGDRPLADALGARLGSERFLLVLDNVEHLLAAAPRVGELLVACPGLRVLATSRRRKSRPEHRATGWRAAVRDAGNRARVCARATGRAWGSNGNPAAPRRALHHAGGARRPRAVPPPGLARPATERARQPARRARLVHGASPSDRAPARWRSLALLVAARLLERGPTLARTEPGGWR